MNSETFIMPLNGTTYVRVGNSGAPMQDVITRYIYGTTEFNYSDRTLKKDITPVTSRINAIDVLKKLEPKSFKWDLSKLYEDGKVHNNLDTTWRYGFIAQGVQEAMPETVHEVEGSGKLAIDYDAIVAVLFEAARQQEDIIESQQANQEKLEEQIRELMLRVQQLQNE